MNADALDHTQAAAYNRLLTIDIIEITVISTSQS
jgi:hypothetical protein